MKVTRCDSREVELELLVEFLIGVIGGKGMDEEALKLSMDTRRVNDADVPDILRKGDYLKDKEGSSVA